MDLPLYTSKKEGGIPWRALIRRLRNCFHQLSEAQQRRVLDFARELAEVKPQGISGPKLHAFAGRILPDELQRMSAAIEKAVKR